MAISKDVKGALESGKCIIVIGNGVKTGVTSMLRDICGYIKDSEGSESVESYCMESTELCEGVKHYSYLDDLLSSDVNNTVIIDNLQLFRREDKDSLNLLKTALSEKNKSVVLGVEIRKLREGEYLLSAEEKITSILNSFELFTSLKGKEVLVIDLNRTDAGTHMNTYDVKIAE